MTLTTKKDPLILYGQSFNSRLLMGTARHPSMESLKASVRATQAEIVTVSLRREAAAGKEGQLFWENVRQMHLKVLPNTAGCFTVKEAMVTAQMAREVFQTSWIKLEVLGDPTSLCPNVIGLLEASKLLISEGFQVFPYMTDDICVAEQLLCAGCEVLMPWAAPIGSGRGINDPYSLRQFRQRFADVPIIVDAGIGRPSQAAAVMEMGIDAILLNTAIAKAGAPVAMASAFRDAIGAGRTAYLAEPMKVQENAIASTPNIGKAELA